MNKTAIEQYRINEDKETYLWGKAHIVFDSSALLDLYFLPKSSREKISNEVFKKLSDRLWLPNQVQYEYLKNRELTISKPIKEKYQPLKKKIQQISVLTKKEISNRIEEIIRETKKDDKHPHLKQELLNKFKEQIEVFLSQNKDFEKGILDEIKLVEEDISKVESDDDVLKSLETYFKVGREFSFDEIIEITKEGKHRYEFKIPPGYGDYYKKEKKGTQIFADLIIWKQILEYSKEKQVPIIFITNDISKDNDWCYLDLKATEHRIFSPREELIKEIKDYSSVDFWMYNLPQFLYHANNYLDSSIQEETIQNFYKVINERKQKGDKLIFKCDKCDRVHKHKKSDVDLDFDCVGGSERNMGTENQYVAEEYFKCNCGNDIKATFEVWEYPVGVHNYDDLRVEGAKLLESFYFSVDFWGEIDEPDFCTCYVCTGNKEEMGNGVSFYSTMELINEYELSHPNHKFSSVEYGNCDWCNELHIKCAKCNSITVLSQHSFDEEIECEGGCGLMYIIDTSEDFEHIGEYDLKLLDHRKTKCSGCGKDFIDVNQTEFCEECEEKYNNE